MRTGLDWKIEESRKVIKAALSKWTPNVGIAFTGGKDSVVLIHLIKQEAKKVPPAMFIDHRLHFKETYDFVKKLGDKWKLNIFREADEKALKNLKKEKKLKKKRELARILKVKTIEKCIGKHDWKALFVGIRWDEHPARASETYFSKRHDHYRVHPILHFKEKDIWSYIKKYKIPYNPLYDKGYRSIGEKPFTKPVEDSKAPERAGREKDKEKIMERLRALGYF